MAKMLKPYVVKELSPVVFEKVVQELINRIDERYRDALEFLAGEGK
jgi:hypothetical protein